MRCADCGHIKSVHLSDAGESVTCRITGCRCPSFAATIEEQPKAEGPRRICIDVPDGYTVSVSLIPWTEQASNEYHLHVDGQAEEADDGDSQAD